ncbi:MAG TPA: M1 family metallopeptidase [Candidatus Dormibacteraeota bacterium]|nr:M1 family metallopeptidase [Candidatus Dormibacteraeota bacterium]
MGLKVSKQSGSRLRAAIIFTGVVLLAARPTAAADGQAARLGHAVVPVFESVRLALDPAAPSYQGSAHVELKGIDRADSFTFHARDIVIGALMLKGRGGRIPVEHAVDGDVVTVKSQHPLEPGAYSLDIDFTAKFNMQAAGLYRIKVDDDWYSFTQFEATDARGAFPCWDEPGFKIPFQITLVVPEAHLAIGNTPIESEAVADGQKTVVFEKTPPLPAYLLAIATGPLETVPIEGMRVPGRIVTIKGASGLAAEAARVTPPLVAALEKYFGIPYPYRKLDLLAVPEFWPGAMENAGAITFADRILLIDPRVASGEQKRTLVAVAAHELAHMWFGDLVTMRWWDDLWLNESFASWMGDRISDQVFPGGRLQIAQVSGMQSAMRTDARLSTRAMRQPIEGVENLDQLADELTYDKGQAVLTMFEAWLGPETFRKGVVAYLKTHAWGSATASDLWASLSKTAGRDVAGPMSTFLDQPGVPLVKVDLLPGGKVRLSQERFLNEGAAAPQRAAWQIPVILKYSDGRTTRTRTLLLKEPSRVVALQGVTGLVWAHPNAGETGYYRWRVPPVTLTVLAAAAPKEMNVRERIGYIGNLEALLDEGALGGDHDLRLLSRFATDPQPEVIDALIEHLRRVKEAFAGEDLKEPFVAYVRSVLSPALQRFGKARAEGEDEAVSLLRPDLLEGLAIEGQDAAILDYADSLAGAYLKDESSIDPALAGVALQLSATRGDMALFKRYRRLFEKARVPADRGRYLTALGSFRSPEVVDAALAYTLHGPLRTQEILTIPSHVSEDPGYRPAVWTWVTENFKPIVDRVPANYGIFLVHYASGCSDERLQAARDFFSDPAHDLPGVQTELKKVADEVSDCVRLRRRERPAVAEFLRSLTDGADSRGVAAGGGARPRSVSE